MISQHPNTKRKYGYNSFGKWDLPKGAGYTNLPRFSSRIMSMSNQQFGNGRKNPPRKARKITKVFAFDYWANDYKAERKV